MISLVVPVYNMEKFLPRCMDTLLKQTYDSYEIILVDDGSSDQSSSMCDCYARQNPEKVRVIHKKNGGLSSARNAGIDVANGKYVVFPDPDDWVEPDYIKCMKELQEKYCADLVCVGHFVDYDTECIPVNEGQQIVQMDEKTAQKALILPPGMNGFAWNKLYHLDVVRTNNLRFLDDVGTTEDLDFAFRYLQFCKTAVFAPENRLYHYYQRDGAATNSGFSNKKLEAINTYKKIIEQSSDEELTLAAQEEICNTAINLIWLYKTSHNNDKNAWKQLKDYIRKYFKIYLHSTRYGTGRKVQAYLAYYVPDIYALLKNGIRKR